MPEFEQLLGAEQEKVEQLIGKPEDFSPLPNPAYANALYRRLGMLIEYHDRKVEGIKCFVQSHAFDKFAGRLPHNLSLDSSFEDVIKTLGQAPAGYDTKFEDGGRVVIYPEKGVGVESDREGKLENIRVFQPGKTVPYPTATPGLPSANATPSASPSVTTTP